MLLSKRHNFIFIHIYKNAGTSIVSALSPHVLSGWQWRLYKALRICGISPPFCDPQPLPAHATASELIDFLGRDQYSDYFSFAVVRNPWDWQVSLYKYMCKLKTHHQHNMVMRLGSFDNYIRWRCDNEVRFQRDFVYSQEGECLVSFIARYETIGPDFQAVCSRVGVEASLPRLNVSNTRPYRDFYTRETKELVRRTFWPDIGGFGYDF